jgi:hypothetical protein
MLIAMMVVMIMVVLMVRLVQDYNCDDDRNDCYGIR